MEGHYQLVFQTVQHIGHLNLAGLGIVWGSGICATNSSVRNSSSLKSSTAWLPTVDPPTGVSECAFALRTFLESCPNGPLLGLLMKSANESKKSTASTTELGPDRARKLSPSEFLKSCFGVECPGTLDLLFAQQCLSEAFPGMFNVTRTLALPPEPVSLARRSKVLAKENLFWKQCASAAEVLFSECNKVLAHHCIG